MEIRARIHANIVILDIAGKIDVNAANFIEVVGQCIRDGYNDILCNFESVEFVDYMGVSVIVIAYKEVVNSHGRMKFVNVGLPIRNILSVAGIDKSIEICANEEHALAAFAEDKVIENIKKMQLRRRFKRLPIGIKVELKSKSAHHPVCLNLDILNMSAIGAYIFGCEKFKLGDEVLLKLRLPPKHEDMEVEAVVVWLPDRQAQPHIYPGMGIEFVHLASGQQQKIVEFIERNLSSMANE